MLEKKLGKKNLAQKKFRSEKILGQKNVGSEKFWVQKTFVS